MTKRRFSIVLAALALLFFCSQPVFAHCGKCGMGEKSEHLMEHQQEHIQKDAMQDSEDCRHHARKHDCENCKLHDREGHEHGKLKCADCEKEGHHGHHGLQDDHSHGHHHGRGEVEGDGKLDELFEKDKS